MSRIKVVAPARWIGKESAAAFEKLAESLGHTVIFDPQCFLQNGQLAGTDVQRAEALQGAIDDPAVDIIWCARGGYGCGRLLERLRPSANRAKTIVGYSDVTVLLLNAARLGLEAVHGPMIIDATSPEKVGNIAKTLQLLTDTADCADLRGLPLTAGRASGPLVAANLCVLTHLLGTPYAPDLTGAILMLEDVGEYLYAIDRMFLHLKQAGVLGRLNGLCLGSFTETQDNDVAWGQTVEEIAQFHTRGLTMPLATGFPVGHGPDNLPIRQFEPCELHVDADGAMIRGGSAKNSGDRQRA